MSKKKHPEHVNHERWLVSYADFITLLFAFFVVLFASGQSDKAKQKKISVAITAAFAQMAIFDPHSKAPSLSDDQGSGAESAPAPVALPMDSASDANASRQSPIPQADPLRAPSLSPEALRREVLKAIEKQLASGALHTGDLTIQPSPEGITLSLHEGGFFDSGSADLRPAARAGLMAIAASLPQLQDQAQSIRIEGHTDNVPIHSALYISNWELSTARAAAIARFVLEHSTLNPQNLSVAGYGEYHPATSNATPEGRAQNRRVDIVFLAIRPGPPAQPVPAPPENAQQGKAQQGKAQQAQKQHQALANARSGLPASGLSDLIRPSGTSGSPHGSPASP
jgi:chemotaxis protein MotB